MGSFTKAEKTQSKLRLALAGPPNSGKTYSAMSIGTPIAQGGKIAFLDSEKGSASKYADLFDFDVLEPTDHHPDRYCEAIKNAASEGYSVMIVDSLTHAWKYTTDVILTDFQIKSKSGNDFAAWKFVTPIWDRLIRSIVESEIHIICTMRSKIEYIVEENSKGKMAPRKVGMAAQVRGDSEYEFDICGDIDIDHNLIITKSRCLALDGKVFTKPGADIAEVLLTWLGTGKPAPDPDIKKKEKLLKQFYKTSQNDKFFAFCDSDDLDALEKFSNDESSYERFEKHVKDIVDAARKEQAGGSDEAGS